MSSGFITEKEVAERRRARQEEWEKNRAEGDPVEAPEEPPHDPRTLYERLQEQRLKKQEEYDEAHKFKNMVRGLEDDEVDFLELVDRTKLQEEIRVRTEENSAIAEYRKKVSAMQKNIAEEEIRAEMKAAEARKNSGGAAKKSSHLSLLAGAIKRKANEEEQTDPLVSGHSKRNRTESPKEEETPTASGTSSHTPQQTSTSTSNTSRPPETPDTPPPPPPAAPKDGAAGGGGGGGLHSAPKSSFRCIAVLPGLGVYTDSSDSDNNVDSDSDEDEDAQNQVPQQPRDITGRIVKPVAQCTGQSGC